MKVHRLYTKSVTGIVSEIIAENFSNLGKHQSSGIFRIPKRHKQKGISCYITFKLPRVQKTKC